ncbi:hypothetical protein [Nocardia sp. CA-119907]|uniref:hypothetical protein n=1 Tax=Nocardia sp. CA-119907 TaxID=3239973 RepID=UPI003D985A37
MLLQIGKAAEANAVIQIGIMIGKRTGISIRPRSRSAEGAPGAATGSAAVRALHRSGRIAGRTLVFAYAFD